MQANGSVIRGHEVPRFSTLLEVVNQWARRNVTRERLEVVILGVGAYGMLGYVMFLLHRATQSWTVMGF